MRGELGKGLVIKCLPHRPREGASRKSRERRYAEIRERRKMKIPGEKNEERGKK